jgi:hypothetical protein
MDDTYSTRTDDPVIMNQLQSEFNNLDQSLQLHGFSRIGDIVNFPKQTLPRLIDTLREIILKKEKESNLKQEYIYKIRSLEHDLSGLQQKIEYANRNIQSLNEEIANLKRKNEEEKSALKMKLLESEKLISKLSFRERSYQNEIAKKQNDLTKLTEQYRKTLENGNISMKKTLEPKLNNQAELFNDSNPLIDEMINNYSRKICEISSENDKLKEILFSMNEKLIQAVSIKGSSFKENYKNIFGETALNEMLKKQKSLLNPTIFQINLIKVSFKQNFNEFVESIEKNFKKLFEFLYQSENLKEISTKNSNMENVEKNIMPGFYNDLIETIDFYKFVCQHQIELIHRILTQSDLRKEEISSIFIRNKNDHKVLLQEINNFLIATKKSHNNIKGTINNGGDSNNIVMEKVDECEYENFVMKCHTENKEKIFKEIEDFDNYLDNLKDFSSQISKSLNI